MGANRLGRMQPWWLLAAVAIVIAAAAAIFFLIRSDEDHGRELALYGLHHREATEKAGETEAGARHGGEESEAGEEGEESEAREASGDVKEAAAKIGDDEGGEAERHGARTPWTEQVANRAFPRNYVDDRRARKVERAFDRLPARAPRSAFRSRRAFDDAVNAAPANWSELGPVTPNVAGLASQFFDPVDQDGPETQESGRLT